MSVQVILSVTSSQVFSQNPTAQKSGVLDKALWSLNLESYLFIPALLALVHRKSPSMTMKNQVMLQ